MAVVEISLPAYGAYCIRELLAVEGELRVDALLVAAGVEADPPVRIVDVDRVQGVDHVSRFGLLPFRQDLVRDTGRDAVRAQQGGVVDSRGADARGLQGVVPREGSHVGKAPEDRHGVVVELERLVEDARFSMGNFGREFTVSLREG